MAGYLTLAIAQAELRRRLAEPTAATYTNGELQEWLEYGARLASILGQTYRVKSAAITMTAGTGIYSIAGKIDATLYPMKVLRVSLVSLEGAADEIDIGLQRVTLNQLGQNGDVTAAAPRQYAVWANNIYLYPLPSAAAVANDTGYTLMVWYTVEAPGTAANAAYATDGDAITGISPTSDVWNHVILDYALGCAYCKSGKHQKAGYHLSSFLQGVAFHRQDLTDDWDRPHSKDMRYIPDYTQIQDTQV